MPIEWDAPATGAPVGGGIEWDKPAKKVPPPPKGAGTMQSPFDLSGGYQGVTIPQRAFYRDRQGNIRQNENGLLRPDGRPQGNPIVATPPQLRAATGAQRDMRSRDESRARRERTSVPQAALSQDRSGALMQGYGFGLGDEIMGLRSGAKTAVLNMLGQDQGYTARQAYDARRKAEADRLAAYAKERPVENAANTIGGALLNPLNVVTGAYAGTSVPRVMAAGGAMGAAYGAGSADPGKRGKGALVSGSIGAATSGVAQQGANMLAANVARRAAAPLSPQRQLSNQGVDLTPGQMLGGGWQRTEDAMTSIPVVGDAIREAQRRGLASLSRATTKRILAPIGGSTDEIGRAGVRDTSQQVSQAYQRALSGVQVAPDQTFANQVAVVQQSPNLPPAVRQELQSTIADVQARLSGPIDGDTWKFIDADLGAAIRAADEGAATVPSSRRLARSLEQLRDAVGGLLERADPNAFARVREADKASAMLERLRKASQYTGTAARDGLVAPGDLNRAVQGMDTSAGNRAYAQGDALLQDLSDAAMQVLPATVPDSGTPFRSLLTTGGIGVGGVGVGAIDPLWAGGIGAGVGLGSALYSRPAMAALNAFYRAQTPGQSTAALQQLAQLAAREPALAPVLEQLRAQRSASRVPSGAGQTPASQQLAIPRKQQ